MSYKYDIFISYKHADLDYAVAAGLQKKLEHYHVPRGIQKKTGKKKINRVFRDEEELSIGHDLSEEIEAQLKETEFLLVICSPASRASIWVKREINIFLKYHPASHILPVLIDGEPEEAFPEVLLGMGEPFAADIRGKNKKEVLSKMNKELERIVAPVLHCSYDELHQRQKRYQMQRFALLLSCLLVVLTAFTAYVLRQNQKISKAYREQLATESHFLVKEGEGLYEDGDYYGALADMVKALPSEEIDRPLIPQAQYNLTYMLGLYQTNSYTKAEGLISSDAGFQEDLFVDSEGKYLILHDSRHLYVYDAKNTRRLHSFTTASDLTMESIPSVNYREDRLVYFSDKYAVYCYDYVAGELIWRKGFPSEIYMTMHRNESSEIWVLTGTNLVLLDDKDGSYLKKKTLSLETEECRSDYACAQAEDGSIYCFSTCSDEEHTIRYYVYDQELNPVSVIRIEHAGQPGNVILEDKRIIFDYTTDQDQVVLQACKLTNGRKLWEHRYSTRSSDRLLKKNQKGIYAEGSCIYCLNNNLMLIKEADGSIAGQSELDSPVAALAYSEENIYAYTTSGRMYNTYASEDGIGISVQSYDMFDHTLLALCKVPYEGIYYVMEEDGCIVKYVTGKSDEHLVTGDKLDYAINSEKLIEYKDGFLTFSENTLYVIKEDGDIQAYPTNLEIGDYDIVSREINGSGELELLWKDSTEGCFSMIRINPESGEILGDKLLYESDAYCYAYSNHILVTVSNGRVCSRDFSTGEECDFRLQTGHSGASFSTDCSLSLSPSGDYIAYQNKDELYLYIIDRKKQETIAEIDLASWTREGITSRTTDWITWQEEKEQCALYNQDTIFFYQLDGELVDRISYREDKEDDESPYGFFTEDGDTFYYLWQGCLYQYDLRKKTCLNQEELSRQTIVPFSWRMKGDILYIEDSSVLYMIETDREYFGLLGKAENVLAYHASNGKIYVRYVSADEPDPLIGIFEEYQLQDIIDMAEEEIGGYDEE